MEMGASVVGCHQSRTPVSVQARDRACVTLVCSTHWIASGALVSREMVQMTVFLHAGDLDAKIRMRDSHIGNPLLYMVNPVSLIP